MFDNLKNEVNLKKWTLAAKLGDVDAMFNLGEYYNHQDLNYTAFTWYKKAADKGHSSAQDIVGHMYYYGPALYNATSRNFAEAVKYFKMTVEKGNFFESKANLAICYYYGLGTERDYKEAVRLFRLAVEDIENTLNGNHYYANYSNYFLGECYLNGYGVAKDVNTAIAYYRKVLDAEPEPGNNNYDELAFYDLRNFNSTTASRNRLRSLGYNV